MIKICRLEKRRGLFFRPLYSSHTVEVSNDESALELYREFSSRKNVVLCVVSCETRGVLTYDVSPKFEKKEMSVV